MEKDTTSRNFRAMLENKWAEGKFICVGLDPDMGKLPPSVIRSAKQYAGAGISLFRLAVVDFCQRIILATGDLSGAFKPNSAFFEGHGAEGEKTLAAVVNMIRTHAPSVPIIGDKKRADIGNTNQGYAISAFKALNVDALTVNPYLGGGSLAPFFNYECNQEGKPSAERGDKGVIVLCRTSNPEASEIQDRRTLVTYEEIRTELELLDAAGITTADKISSEWIKVTIGGVTNYVMPLYQWVAIRFAARWNTKGNCALVVGATVPGQLAKVRALVGDTMPLLLPGVGFQQSGVPLEDQVKQTVEAGRDSRGSGFIINVSRSVLYASSGENFAEAARAEVLKMNQLVAQFRS